MTLMYRKRFNDISFRYASPMITQHYTAHSFIEI